MLCYYTLAHFIQCRSRVYRTMCPSTPPGHHVLLLAPVLFSASNSAVRGVRKAAVASLASCCSAAALLQLVCKCVMLEILKEIFFCCSFTGRKSRIILWIRRLCTSHSEYALQTSLLSDIKKLPEGECEEIITLIEYYCFQEGRENLRGKNIFMEKLSNRACYVAYHFPRLC